MPAPGKPSSSGARPRDRVPFPPVPCPPAAQSRAKSPWLDCSSTRGSYAGQEGAQGLCSIFMAVAGCKGQELLGSAGSCQPPQAKQHLVIYPQELRGSVPKPAREESTEQGLAHCRGCAGDTSGASGDLKTSGPQRGGCPSPTIQLCPGAVLAPACGWATQQQHHGHRGHHDHCGLLVNTEQLRGSRVTHTDGEQQHSASPAGRERR